MQSSYLCWLSEMQIYKMSRSYDFTRYIFIVDKISISDWVPGIKGLSSNPPLQNLDKNKNLHFIWW